MEGHETCVLRPSPIRTPAGRLGPAREGDCPPVQNTPLTQTFYGLPRPSRLRRAARGLSPRPSKRPGSPLADELAQLQAEGYRVLPRGEIGGDLTDHIVVGPTGIFLIRVNRWRGRFSFRRDGWFRHTKKDAGELVSQVAREATTVKARLGEPATAPPVEGIVAVARSRMPHPVIQMGWVTFVAAPCLISYLRSRRSALSTEQVDRVAADIPA